MLLSSLVNAFVGSAWLFTVSPASHRPPPKPGAISGPPPEHRHGPPRMGSSRLTPFFPPHQANLYLGLMLMCGFVLFDTQLIIEKAESGDKDYIWWGPGPDLGGEGMSQDPP